MSPIHPFKMATLFVAQETIDFGDAWEIVERTRRLMQRQSNVVPLEAPYTLVGDLHGQFFDLVKIFEVAGDPPHTRFLFLGDYVDRGRFSCEVILYLFALKLTFPDAVHLLRGNHECASVSAVSFCSAFALVPFLAFFLCGEAWERHFVALPPAQINRNHPRCIRTSISVLSIVSLSIVTLLCCFFAFAPLRRYSTSGSKKNAK